MKLRLSKMKMIGDLKTISRPRNMGMFRIKCNLCHGVFRAASRFYRFCRTCRIEDERFRFSEWLGT